MKTVLGIVSLFLALIIISCTKNKSGNNSSNGSTYSCYCWFITPSMRDTTITYTMGGMGYDSATYWCKKEDTAVKSISGPTSGAFCRLN